MLQSCLCHIESLLFWKVLTRENIEAVVRFAQKEKLFIFADEVNIFADEKKLFELVQKSPMLLFSGVPAQCLRQRQ